MFVRSVMTVVVVWVLKIPGLMLVSGLSLLWITFKLLADQGSKEHDGPVASTFWDAMKTIMVANTLMGVDNVPGCGVPVCGRPSAPRQTILWVSNSPFNHAFGNFALVSRALMSSKSLCQRFQLQPVTPGQKQQRQQMTGFAGALPSAAISDRFCPGALVL